MNELEDIIRQIQRDQGDVALSVLSLKKQLEEAEDRLVFLGGQLNAVQQLKPQITGMIAKAVEESRQEPK